MSASSEEPYMVALYRAESMLLIRSNQMRKDARVADANGRVELAAALRGKAIGLKHGADQIARIIAALQDEGAS